MTESNPVPPTSAPWEGKSTLEEIRERFDNDVERFSKLETGQQATIDAPLILDIVSQTAVHRLRPDSHILDLGCGAGNFTMRVLHEMRKTKETTDPLFHCHLADLSRPMLSRAESRLHEAGAASVRAYQSDLRRLHFAENSFCCILAGAVLHHLRDDDDWADVFAKLHRWLRPGGRVYVSDLMWFDAPEVQKVMWERYGAYLESLGGPAYREKVFAYVEKEDSPRSLPYQLELLRRSGFSSCEVLHRNSVFACYYGMK